MNSIEKPPFWTTMNMSLEGATLWNTTGNTYSVSSDWLLGNSSLSCLPGFILTAQKAAREKQMAAPFRGLETVQYTLVSFCWLLVSSHYPEVLQMSVFPLADIYFQPKDSRETSPHNGSSLYSSSSCCHIRFNSGTPLHLAVPVSLSATLTPAPNPILLALPISK